MLSHLTKCTISSNNKIKEFRTYLHVFGGSAFLHKCLSFLEKEAEKKQQTRCVTRALLFSRCLNHQRFLPSVLVKYESEFHSGLLT